MFRDSYRWIPKTYGFRKDESLSLSAWEIAANEVTFNTRRMHQTFFPYCGLALPASPIYDATDHHFFVCRVRCNVLKL